MTLSSASMMRVNKPRHVAHLSLESLNASRIEAKRANQNGWPFVFYRPSFDWCRRVALASARQLHDSGANCNDCGGLWDDSRSTVMHCMFPGTERHLPQIPDATRTASS
jgi:hypothetical protein